MARPIKARWGWQGEKINRRRNLDWKEKKEREKEERRSDTPGARSQVDIEKQ